MDIRFRSGDLMSNKVEVPEIGFVALLRFGWRQLTSMRTALILLMLLGIAAIPGSLIPQRITNPIAVRDFYINDPNMALFKSWWCFSYCHWHIAAHGSMDGLDD